MRALLLVVVLAQLLACHAVVTAAAEVPSAVQESGGHGPASAATCEPLGTPPVVGACRTAATASAGPRDVQGQQVGGLVLLILLAAAAGSRGRPAPSGRAVPGRHRLLAVGIIRV